jgi:D-inositol-3-phosphate glycosyltransferase
MLTVWVVDPISYTGMVYTDVASIQALEAAGATAVLVGSDRWILGREMVLRRAVFRGTSGPGHRIKRGFAYVVSAVRLVRSVHRARPDVVHWQYTELPVVDLAAAALIRFIGVPQVYTAHEVLPWSASRHHRTVFRAFFLVLSAIVVHDSDRGQILRDRFGVPEERIHVIALGDYAPFATPKLDQREARARLGLPPDVPIALFFGAIRPSKGLEVLTAAWQDVRRRVPDAHLVIAGKPFKGLDVEPLLRALRPDDGSVTIDLRQVSPDEANDLYRAADVIVLPYHDIGTSGVLRYAYNSRRPVVATAVGEHRAHVIEGSTGFLVPPRDVAALGEALATALVDRARLAWMGDEAATYAREHFDWSAIGRSFMKLYETLGSARTGD